MDFFDKLDKEMESKRNKNRIDEIEYKKILNRLYSEALKYKTEFQKRFAKEVNVYLSANGELTFNILRNLDGSIRLAGCPDCDNCSSKIYFQVTMSFENYGIHIIGGVYTEGMCLGRHISDYFKDRKYQNREKNWEDKIYTNELERVIRLATDYFLGTEKKI
jgi:hypothetical protein